MIYILAPRTSQSAKQLAEACGYRHIWGTQRQMHPVNEDDLVVNYGYSGQRYTTLGENFPIIRRLDDQGKILNRVSGIRKDVAIQRVSEAGVSCPETVTALPDGEFEGWIFKPYRSGQGRGIHRMAHPAMMSYPTGQGYFQKEVMNREYEIRVSAFNWRDQGDWGVWKRTCTDHGQLCWNHHQGGRFITIRRPTQWRVFRDAIAASQIVLDTLNMDFGAIDFILDSERRVQFIEINSRPGFTEIGRQIYVEAFKALADAEQRQGGEAMSQERELREVPRAERQVPRMPLGGMVGEDSHNRHDDDDSVVDPSDWLLNQVREAQQMIRDGLRMVADGERRLNQLTQT